MGSMSVSSCICCMFVSCVQCAYCGSSQCCILHDLLGPLFINGEVRRGFLSAQRDGRCRSKMPCSKSNNLIHTVHNGTE